MSKSGRAAESTLDRLLARLVTVLEVAERADAVDRAELLASSAPASNPDPTRGQACLVVVDEHGQPDAVPATSVELQAFAALDGQARVEHALVAGYARKALAAVVDAVALVDTAQGHLDAIDRILDVEDTPARREAVCAEQHCEDPAAAGRGGRCEPCYRWQRRWRDEHGGDVPPPVPARVIQVRLEERDRRRQHVDPGGFVHGIGTVDRAIAGGPAA